MKLNYTNPKKKTLKYDLIEHKNISKIAIYSYLWQNEL